MDTIKRINTDEIRIIAQQKEFPQPLLTKDYYITVLLYLLRDISGIYFKGGTALNKIFLNYARLSEDIDFTVTEDPLLIQEKIKVIITKSGLFNEVSRDNTKERFVRLVIAYEDALEKGSIFIDLNKKGSLILPPEKHKIPHFYGNFIPDFSVSTISFSEMLAEKMRATIERNKPRDHFDLYQIITHQLPLDLQLVQKKCTESGSEFDITKMFNRANRLKHRWDEDMGPLLSKKITFEEVMSTLAKHFNLKGEEEKKKKMGEEIRNSDGYKKLLKNISSLIEKLPPEVRSEMRKHHK